MLPLEIKIMLESNSRKSTMLRYAAERPAKRPGDFPESLTQAMLVGTMLVGGLGVRSVFIISNRKTSN